jgi:hypothetical protein
MQKLCTHSRYKESPGLVDFIMSSDASYFVKNKQATMAIVCIDKYGLPVFCSIGWMVNTTSDIDAIEGMAFARGFELADESCGHNKIIRGETDSLNFIRILGSEPMELALTIIQGEFSQSKSNTALRVARHFLRGGSNSGHYFTERHIPRVHNNVADYLARLGGNPVFEGLSQKKEEDFEGLSQKEEEDFEGLSQKKEEEQPVKWMTWSEAVPRGVKRQLLKQMGTTFLLLNAQPSNQALKIRMATMNPHLCPGASREQHVVKNEINSWVEGT